MKRCFTCLVFLVGAFVLFLLIIDHRDVDLNTALPIKVCREFVHPVQVEIDGYDGDAMEPFISRDDRFLFFNNLNSRSVNTNIFYAERTGDHSFRFRGGLAGVNGGKLDAVPSMDTHGSFFFISTRSYALKPGMYGTLFSGDFRRGRVVNVHLLHGPIDREQFGWLNMGCEISPDGEELYISRARFLFYFPPPRRADIVTARRRGNVFFQLDKADDPCRLINTEHLEYAPSTTADGLELFFTRCFFPGILTSRKTRFFLCYSRRPDRKHAFGPPELIESAYESDPYALIEAPSISGDGKVLYYHKKVDGKFRIFSLRRRTLTQ